MASKKSKTGPMAPIAEVEDLVSEPVSEQSEAPRPHTPRRPQAPEIKLSARQYCRARGQRWERCAGFLYDMRTKHPGDKTRDEWDQLWAAFWTRPVK